MSPTGPDGIVLLGAPGAGCGSVARALGRAMGLPVRDLGAVVAERLGVEESLALVAVGEERYRRVEAEAACALLADLAGTVTALGSGCLADAGVRSALERARCGGARTVLLTATTRRLATRNGLDAPRSVALGNVHHAFTQMLRAREDLCRRAAGAEAVVVDTTSTTPEQAAAETAGLLGAPAPS
ncbi:MULTISPECIES: shikimate kinase [Actinomyces]|uniref:Shikimate kinase n=1 Tax=Actinomyces respiraculi TaxID=2744574 RepID=A0A7T0LME4_9ACTO|nr:MULTISPECIES: shikimate kinase [Actinomyces]QPL06439.1 shikimate kinase [Actinomyces respiraculi]